MSVRETSLFVPLSVGYNTTHSLSLDFWVRPIVFTNNMYIQKTVGVFKVNYNCILETVLHSKCLLRRHCNQSLVSSLSCNSKPLILFFSHYGNSILFTLFKSKWINPEIIQFRNWICPALIVSPLGHHYSHCCHGYGFISIWYLTSICQNAGATGSNSWAFFSTQKNACIFILLASTHWVEIRNVFG